MGKFKVGDRVRCVREWPDLTVGNVYTVSAFDDDKVGVIDDVGDMNYWGEYELADDVGAIDWTKSIELIRDGTPLKVLSGPAIDGNYRIGRADGGHFDALGSGHSYAHWYFTGKGEFCGEEECGPLIRNVVATDASTDASELAELRAFRDAAIAKYPDLAPVDPDLIEARRLTAMACKWFDGGDALGKAERIERGDWDDARAGIVQAIYASLKAARGG